MEIRSNKKIVSEFYKKVIGERDLSLVDHFVSDKYVQHSSMGKDGKAGLIEMLQFLKTIPRQVHQQSPITMLIGEGDLVAIQLDIELYGVRKLVLDLFRVESGMLVEHWDIVQDVPLNLVNEIGKVQNTPEDIVGTAANKKLVLDYYDSVFVDKQFDKADVYGAFSSKTVDKPILAGILTEKLSNVDKEFDVVIHQVVADGRLVMIQAEYTDHVQKLALYSVFEVLQNSIVSQWSLQQSVPDVLPHQNGMF